MTVTEIKEISAKKVLIITDEEYDLPLSSYDVKKYKILPGSEIDSDLLEEIKEKVIYPVALNKALYLIRAKEYTKHEMEQKLVQSHYPEDIITSVLNELEKNRFIDDERYVENYISCHCAVKSVQAVKSTLMTKGVEKDTIEEAIDHYQEENPDQEMILCKQLLEKKYSSGTDEPDFNTVNKAKMFLVRKGFSYSVADSAVKEFFDI